MQEDMQQAFDTIFVSARWYTNIQIWYHVYYCKKVILWASDI